MWEWDSGSHGLATEGLLTEKNDPYVGIMVGTFSTNLPYYQGFKNANLNSAKNLKASILRKLGKFDEAKSLP